MNADCGILLMNVNTYSHSGAICHNHYFFMVVSNNLLHDSHHGNAVSTWALLWKDIGLCNSILCKSDSQIVILLLRLRLRLWLLLLLQWLMFDFCICCHARNFIDFHSCHLHPLMCTCYFSCRHNYTTTMANSWNSMKD